MNKLHIYNLTHWNTIISCYIENTMEMAKCPEDTCRCTAF